MTAAACWPARNEPAVGDGASGSAMTDGADTGADASRIHLCIRIALMPWAMAIRPTDASGSEHLSQNLGLEGCAVASPDELLGVFARRRWSVTLERTVREMQGQTCIAFEDTTASTKQIPCTRSFGTAITKMADLVESVTEFASRAYEKLRKQRGHVGQVLVFIHTSPFRGDAQYSRSITVPLRKPTADSGLIASSAVQGLRAIFRPGFRYAKAGVMLLDLQDAAVEQHELDLDEASEDRSRLMGAMDAINDRYGRGALTLASAGTAREARAWVMKQDLKTPNYTTCWTELPCARA